MSENGKKITPNQGSLKPMVQWLLAMGFRKVSGIWVQTKKN